MGRQCVARNTSFLFCQLAKPRFSSTHETWSDVRALSGALAKTFPDSPESALHVSAFLLD
jgi:hypothetical protein